MFILAKPKFSGDLHVYMSNYPWRLSGWDESEKFSLAIKAQKRDNSRT